MNSSQVTDKNIIKSLFLTLASLSLSSSTSIISFTCYRALLDALFTSFTHSTSSSRLEATVKLFTVFTIESRFMLFCNISYSTAHDSTGSVDSSGEFVRRIKKFPFSVDFSLFFYILFGRSKYMLSIGGRASRARGEILPIIGPTRNKNPHIPYYMERSYFMRKSVYYPFPSP